MKKMKFLSIMMLMAFVMPLFIGCGSSEKDFDEKLSQGYVCLIKTMYGNALVFDEICNAWKDAIYNKETPSGKYTCDFNEALYEIMDTLDAYDIRSETKLLNDSLLEITSNLNPPPSSRKDCYDDFVDMVTDVSTLNRLALEPSGSLKEYRDKNKELFDNVAKKIDKFRIKYGSILPKKDNIEVE